MKLLGVVLSPNTHWIWCKVLIVNLIAFFSTLSQHSAMGMVETQKIRYPSHHPTVLQRISGLIPSLWSLSVTKFPYGNVDCALEKTENRRHGFSLSLSALWVGELQWKKILHAFASVYMACLRMFHVAPKKWDDFFQLHLKLRLAAFDIFDQGHGPSCCKVPCTTFPTRHVKLMGLFLRCEILVHTLAIWLTMWPLDWAYRLWLWIT